MKTPPPPPPGIGITETRGGGRHARPFTTRSLILRTRFLHDALDDITRDYREVYGWCHSLDRGHGYDKPIVQISDPSDPTGQTVLQREGLSRALEREVCRRMDRAYDELAGAANWLRHVQEYGE